MGFFSKGLEGFAGAGTLGKVSWDENKIKIVIVDMDDAGPAPGAFKIRSMTYVGSTVTVETGTSGGAVAHGLGAGDPVEIFGAAGITNVSGEFDVLSSGLTATQFQFVAADPPTGTHTADTGYLVDLSLTYLSELVPAGGRIATSAALTNKSIINGVLDADSVVFNNVTGDRVEAWVAVRAAAAGADADLADTAQRLILAQTSASPGLTGLPQTPVGGNINLNFSEQGIARI